MTLAIAYGSKGLVFMRWMQTPNSKAVIDADRCQDGRVDRGYCEVVDRLTSVRGVLLCKLL